jgi:ABC-type antimicrobial peptide transport system permease subunit
LQVVQGVSAKIVGVSFDEMAMLAGDSVFEFIEELTNQPNFVMAKLSGNQSKNKEFFEYLKDSEKIQNGVYTKIKPLTSATNTIDGFYTYIELFKTILLYVSIAFSFFVVLLMINFISVSVSERKKEIGILRAVGAKGSDIFKIFACEGLMIGLGTFVFSYLTVLILSLVVNGIIKITMLVPGFVPIISMFSLSVGVSILSTFIATYKISKAKPVEAIRN